MTKKTNMNRREFMKLLAKGGAMGALSSIGQLSLVNEAIATDPGFPDYKAMVCLFFLGGNDGFNMLIPNDASYANYAAVRGELAVNNQDLNLSSLSSALHNGTLGKGSNNPYNVDHTHTSAYTKGVYDLSNNGFNMAVHGLMPEFAQLIADNKISAIANVGNMVAPVTKQQIIAETANLPLFLFAHNHQQRALQTGQGNNLNDIGWAGKIADAWLGINGGSNLAGLNISFGNRRMMIGKTTSPMVLGEKVHIPTPFLGMGKGEGITSDEQRALFRALSGLPSEASGSALNFSTNSYTNSNPFKQLYSEAMLRAMNLADKLPEIWDNNPITYSSKGSYGERLFAVPSSNDLGFNNILSGDLIKKLETVAKMIELGTKDAFATGNHTRQIFFVGVPGYDTHNNQAYRHSRLLREISLGLWKFQKAMEELGHEEKVTTFSMSDFGRTMTINGGNGTDHAWGSHHFVMGGAGTNATNQFNGGKLFGTPPDLSLNGSDDYSEGKGQYIPTTSQDQVNASICKWFGVDESLISTIFPNLANFQTTSGDISSAFLKNLFVA
ncbi:MAG: DUF1501 domain-containing protein [Endozoicomonadaceae bacterium]|nr:DUF1501 domain-containing protein [Endozoicomonadaceae bacterium]